MPLLLLVLSPSPYPFHSPSTHILSSLFLLLPPFPLSLLSPQHSSFPLFSPSLPSSPVFSFFLCSPHPLSHSPINISHSPFSFPSPLTPLPSYSLPSSSPQGLGRASGCQGGGKKQRSLLLYPTPLPLSLSFLLLMWETPCQAPHPSVQSIPCRLLVTPPPSPHPTLGSWYM